MTKDEILKKIKKIEIASNILASEIFSGNYRSFFKGNGMEFSDIRRYALGDDIKKIDWKVTARQRKTYIKEFTEEREMPIYIVIDVSNSTNFTAKKDLIAQLIGTISFSAIKNNDKVGAIFFSNNIEKIIPTKKNKNQVFVILDDYLSFESKSKKTDISKVLNNLQKILKQRSIIFLISDFLDSNYEKAMNMLKFKHDLIPIRISDSKYDILPNGAIYTFEDSESGERVIIDNLKSSFSLIENIPKQILTISTTDDYVKKLINFLKNRRRK